MWARSDSHLEVRPANPPGPPLPPQPSLHCPTPQGPPSSSDCSPPWHGGRGGPRARGIARRAQRGGWATPGAASPFPLLPDPACGLGSQPQQLHFSLQGLSQTSASGGVGRLGVGPSSTAFPRCFSSKGHRHTLCLITRQGVSGGGPDQGQRCFRPSPCPAATRWARPAVPGPQSCSSIPPPGRRPTSGVSAVGQGAVSSSSASGWPRAGRERQCGTENRPRKDPFGSLETWVLAVALPCPPQSILVNPFSLLASVSPSVHWGVLV